MHPDQIARVKASWAKLEPISAQAGDMFYGRLFETNPELVTLFQSEISDQSRKLMAMIDTAVGSLDKIDEMMPQIKALGARHSRYGVKPEDYTKVRDALPWTLNLGLGEAFTLDVRNAWVEVYQVLEDAMQEGSAEMDAKSG